MPRSRVPRERSGQREQSQHVDVPLILGTHQKKQLPLKGGLLGDLDGFLL